MKKLINLSILWIFLFSACNQNATNTEVEKVEKESPNVVLVIHGGAGTIKKENMTDEMEKAYLEVLEEALLTGYDILRDGGESCEAVKATIIIMENSPLFNAGVGAVFTAEETIELDASIMSGKDKNAGAIASVKTIKNPILAAFEVMTNSPHVMLAGEGADIFAKERGLEIVNQDYFKTENRKKQLMKVKKEYGTVGAVALDQQGNICAGTSTGGMTNKKWGRIGDAPIIGAGTYADNLTCGVSATGHGEYFIRSNTAYDVSALMKYKNYDLETAATESIKKTEQLGGIGGLIALDAKGNVSMPFSSEGMYRGFITQEGVITLKIYKE